MEQPLSIDQKKEWAEQLYTVQGLTIRDVALKTGVSEAVVRQWINESDWDGRMRTLFASRQTQLAQLYDLLEKVNNKMKEAEDVNPKDVDLALKYTTAIKNLDADVSVPQIIEVAKLFTTWLLRIDLDFAKAVTLRFDTFIRERLKGLPC